MDWFSWLSKAGLDPSLVYQYGVAFTHNELEEDDIRYFNHEFLQSMGISIAKHRLEILKLAKKDKKLLPSYYTHNNSNNQVIIAPRSMSRVFVSIKRSTKRCLSQILKNLIRGGRDDGCYGNSCNSSALVVVHQQPTGYHGSRWRGGATSMKRNSNKKMLTDGDKQGRLLLTNGNTMSFSSSWGNTPRIHSFSSPMVGYDQDQSHDQDQKGEKTKDGDQNGYWVSSTGVEEIRWDTMFQNLKPN